MSKICLVKSYIKCHAFEAKQGRDEPLNSRRRRAWELNSVVVDAKYGPVQMEFKRVSLLGITDRVGWLDLPGNSGRSCLIIKVYWKKNTIA